MLPIAASATLWLCSAAILAGMVADLLTYRIPNLVSLLVVALFPVLLLLAGGDRNWLAHVGIMAGFFAAGLLLFRFGWFGGGDVKFLAAVGLWIDPPRLAIFLMHTTLIGGALALLLLGLRRLPADWLGRRLPARLRGLRILAPGAPVPYGVAIGLGALTTGLG